MDRRRHNFYMTKKLSITIRLSKNSQNLSCCDGVEINGVQYHVTESHLSSFRVCVHIDHPLIERVSFEQ